MIECIVTARKFEFFCKCSVLAYESDRNRLESDRDQITVYIFNAFFVLSIFIFSNANSSFTVDLADAKASNLTLFHFNAIVGRTETRINKQLNPTGTVA